MAIIANKANSKLKLSFNAGLDDKDKDIIKNKTLGNIKPDATNEDLYDLGVGLSDLQEHTLVDLVRYEEYQLINEI